MYKIISNLTSLPELSREEFIEHWQQVHKPLILALPKLIAYRQSPAIEHKTKWPANGLAELWFDSLSDIRAAFEGPEADAMREDEKNLLSNISWYIVEEGEILKP